MPGDQLDFLHLLGAEGVTTPAAPHVPFMAWSWYLGSGRVEYRPWCRMCDWQPPARHYERENDSVEAALDHAWPGWRLLPILPPVPAYDQPNEEWKAAAVAAYPAGWLEAGGPVKTLADSPHSRHRQYRTPWDGFEVAANLLGGAS